MLSVTPYRSIAVAATFSPRFHQVLAEANRVRARFGSVLSMIYVGKCDAATTRKFSEAIVKLKLPANSTVHYGEGDPASTILAAARKLKVELLVAGALEKEAVHRQFLGNVARRLAREAACSVMLFTKPELEPKPLRHIVFMAEYSEHAQVALRRTLHLAERENCERLYVIRSYTSFDKARAARRSKSGKGIARTLEEEEIALQEFILAAGATKSDRSALHPRQYRVCRVQFRPGGRGRSARRPAGDEGRADLWPTDCRAGFHGSADVIPCKLWIRRAGAGPFYEDVARGRLRDPSSACGARLPNERIPLLFRDRALQPLEDQEHVLPDLAFSVLLWLRSK